MLSVPKRDGISGEEEEWGRNEVVKIPGLCIQAVYKLCDSGKLYKFPQVQFSPVKKKKNGGRGRAVNQSNCVPPQDVEVLAPSTCECDSIWI